jgi:uncharacterized RDD family membrane protein YckC
MNHTQTTINTNYAGLIRRLFAIFYDSFLLIAILFIVTGIATALNQGAAIEPNDTFYPLYVIIVFGLSYLYFAWFWIHGGQTLGMKTWRIQLYSPNNKEISWKIASIRFFSAFLSWGIFGLGFLWAFIDKKNRCWHDLLSHTELLDLRISKQK